MTKKNLFGLTSGTQSYNYGYGVDDSDKDGYQDLLVAVKEMFAKAIEAGDTLFTTNVENVYETGFLGNLPADAKQHYTCRSCGNFLNRYGNLVTINEKGELKSAMWDENAVPSYFHSAVREMRYMVESAKVNGMFLSDTAKLGNEKTGEWNHIAVRLPRELVKKNTPIQTVEQAIAEKKEEFKMLNRALLDYSVKTIDTAITLLESESLYRSEKVLGIAKWFKEVTKVVNSVSRRNADNIIWLAVASAPKGFTHIRSSMIGTLLTDIEDGYSFDQVKSRFEEKMNPLKYQRPQSAPKLGNIKRGNEIIEKLGLERSLARRFARVDELKTEWKPRFREVENRLGGIFGHLTPKERTNKAETMVIPGNTNMTWEKFSEKILPNAEKIEFLVPTGRANYSSLVTAQYADAEPIIKWDNELQRNPFNWYVYHNGSNPSSWNLNGGTYVDVTAITLQPSSWYEPEKFKQHGNSIFFILDGAKDRNYASSFGNGGSALFPETLISDLHEIRATIEAYSSKSHISGYGEASAAGIRLQKGSNWNAKLRVTTKDGVAKNYTLDRWE